jgi:subtilisin family serine protease
MNCVPFRRFFLALLAVVLLGSLQPFPEPVEGTPTGAPDDTVTVRPGAVLVKFKADFGPATATALSTRYGATVERTWNTGVRELRVPEGEEWAVSRALATDPDVLFAEPDILWEAVGALAPAVAPSDPWDSPSATATSPEDPFYDRQWAHTRIRSSSAWDLTTGDVDLTIAVIDTGIDSLHPDLSTKLVPGHSFLTDDQGRLHEDDDPVDINGHGTHVAGIAAAVTDNKIGVAGMSWGARIMPVRVLNREGKGWTSDIARGIIWARQNGADVINLSLGSERSSDAVRDAVEDAHDAGILLVAAMGNNESEAPFYPAAYPDTVAVSATNVDDNLAWYSNYGSYCDVAAPGGELFNTDFTEGIYSTLPTGDGFYLYQEYGYPSDYYYLQGTSQAAPFVAGLGALVWSVDDTLTPDQVQQVIEASAVDIGTPGKDKQFGHGRIDARAALDLANIPDAPILFSIVNPDRDGTYLVDWSDVDRVTRYELQRDDHTGFSSPDIVAKPIDSSFNVQGQLPGFWYYRVRATNESGASPWSDAQRTEVVPAAPAFTGIQTLAPDAYRLSWDGVFGAQTYRLVEADTLSFTRAVTRYLGASLAYTVTGQPSGTWYYRVEAGGEAGFSDPSAVLSATTVADPVPAPEFVTPIDNDDGDAAYSVTWSEVATATTYILEESAGPYFYTPVAVYQGEAMTHTVTAQPIGRWHYRVRAVTPEGQRSPWSAAASAVVPDFIYLPVVMR